MSNFLIGLASVLLGLLFLGWAYQTLASAQDRRKYPPPGKLLDIGGFRLHLYSTGSSPAGRPIVIMESGPGMPALFWSLIQPEVAKFARVITYDRAGLGWSEPGPVGVPRTSRQIVDELRALLSRAGITGPYVLVGYSFGGHHVRLFANQYPDEVAGLVLLDASHEDQFQRFPKPYGDMGNQAVRFYSLLPTLARLGVLRLAINAFLFFKPPNWPRAIWPLFKMHFSDVGHWQGSYAEALGTLESEAQMRAIHLRLGDKPLMVLTELATWDNAASLPRGVTPGQMRAAWLAMQTEHTGISTNSTHIVAEKNFHGTFALDPQRAPQAVDAIRQVVLACETKKSAS